MAVCGIAKTAIKQQIIANTTVNRRLGNKINYLEGKILKSFKVFKSIYFWLLHTSHFINLYFPSINAR